MCEQRLERGRSLVAGFLDVEVELEAEFKAWKSSIGLSIVMVKNHEFLRSLKNALSKPQEPFAVIER